jgi:hypothetical protein
VINSETPSRVVIRLYGTTAIEAELDRRTREVGAVVVVRRDPPVEYTLEEVGPLERKE